MSVARSPAPAAQAAPARTLSNLNPSTFAAAQDEQLPTNRAAPSGTPSIPPRFAQLFASSVSRVISNKNTRSRAELAVETDAAIFGLNQPELDAYVPAALAELDTLTVEQAARYRITAAQYATWRAVYPLGG